MDQRINYYVSRKNFFTWLSIVSFFLTIVLRICFYQPVELLPIIGSILFVLIIVVNGDEHFYKTAVPVFLFAVYFGIKGFGITTIRWTLLLWIACIGTAYIYFRTSCGKEKNWLILLIFLAIFAYLCYQNRLKFNFGTLPDLSLLFAMICIVFSMKMHLDGEWHPTWGDRSDGRKLRTLSPITIVANYIMPTRVGSSNHIHDKVEISRIEEYIFKKRKEGYKGFGMTHILLATYVRCVAKYPGLNRFLSGQQIYSRGNDIQFCMAVKDSMTLEGGESIIKLHLLPSDTVFDIYDKLDKEIKRVKEEAVGGSDFDKTAKFFSYIPGVIFKLVIWFLKVMDYFGLIPKFLLEISPFHASVFFTSMASLGIPPVVHHLYNFGNMPVFCSFGSRYTTKDINDDGSVSVHKWMDYTFNTDERILDGFYYASVFKYFKKLLAHPEKLEKEPEIIKRDID